MKRVAKSRWKKPGGGGPALKPVLIACGAVALLGAGLLAFGYYRFSRMIDERLSGKSFQTESQVLTAPKRISVGQLISAAQLGSYLSAAGYTRGSDPGAAGRISVTASSLEIRPSANSFFSGKHALRVDFARNRITQLRSLETGDHLISAEIEPELITDLFSSSREKRRPVRYGEFPVLMRNAVLSAEDKRFFDHPGLDFIRILGAAWADIRRGEKAQGASTITMQVARSFFFDTRREWSRKLKETLMALILEHRFRKEQIFELYANEVYLGNRGSFAIHGFGEAAQAYFGKDLRDLSLAETCFLAGIVRAPNRYAAAERRPERAADARDRVLALMLDNGFISKAQDQAARRSPLRLVSGTFGASLAGNFVDMMKDDLLDRFSETELLSENYRIYTTLDSDLQRAAMTAVDWGVKNLDLELARTYEYWRKHRQEIEYPQVALIALDPHTGDIKALVGGRDYAKSQLNHALVKRQPGSAFKPFVYAAAFENALDGTDPALLPTSTVLDEPTAFVFDGRQYTPDNYGQRFYGTVTLRDALVHSLNVATVKVAEQVGFARVVEVARRMGLGADIKPTPSVALGAYEMTPLEIAAAYTAFANYGTRCETRALGRVVGPGGDLLESKTEHRKPVLDPRVTYLVTNILEDVVNRGTGAVVRSRGFLSPAAGKTGTSHDGWFVGYTTNLLCVVWVGFDDNRELGLSGASSAAPIWAEFMKRAVMLPAFSNVQEFERPEGVVSVTIDPGTQQLATPECPETRQEVFLAGTEPTESCTLHRPASRVPGLSWLARLFRRGATSSAPQASRPRRPAAGGPE